MIKEPNLKTLTVNGNGYEYRNQVFVIGYIVQDCGHPASMNCGCNARRFAGCDIRDIVSAVNIMKFQADNFLKTYLSKCNR